MATLLTLDIDDAGVAAFLFQQTPGERPQLCGEARWDIPHVQESRPRAELIRRLKQWLAGRPKPASFIVRSPSVTEELFTVEARRRAPQRPLTLRELKRVLRRAAGAEQLPGQRIGMGVRLVAFLLDGTRYEAFADGLIGERLQLELERITVSAADYDFIEFLEQRTKVGCAGVASSDHLMASTIA